MKDFATSIDVFLKFDRYEMLEEHEHITYNAAKQKVIGKNKELQQTSKNRL